MLSSDLNARYQSDLRDHGYSADSAQQKAICHLQALSTALQSSIRDRPGAFRLRHIFARRPNKPIRGVYLWGGVGRGKTYLMDLFFESLPFEKKMRTHFHRFMRLVHKELDLIKGSSNPLETIAEKFSKKYRIICFDEFFVVDITDAMILAGLLDGLFRRGVVLVATSNIAPDGLYSDGLQRQRFLPAISLLEEHTKVLNVDGGVDYRLRTLKQSQLYYFPLTDLSANQLSDFFDLFLHGDDQPELAVDIDIENRPIRAKKVYNDIIWFDFKRLCDGPRSQNDYIEIAREYQTVIVSKVPYFTDKNNDQARRFIYLVDELYDRHVKLVLSAQDHFSKLYQSGRLAFEFQRTQSRLQEMQSETYLGLAHRD